MPDELPISGSVDGLHHGTRRARVAISGVTYFITALLFLYALWLHREVRELRQEIFRVSPFDVATVKFKQIETERLVVTDHAGRSRIEILGDFVTALQRKIELEDAGYLILAPGFIEMRDGQELAVEGDTRTLKLTSERVLVRNNKGPLRGSSMTQDMIDLWYGGNVRVVIGKTELFNYKTDVRTVYPSSTITLFNEKGNVTYQAP